MAEVLLAPQFWNKVYKLLKPATVVAVKRIKGAGKDKLIPSNYCLNLNNHTNNKSGFMLKCMFEHYKSKNPSRYSDNWILSQVKASALAAGITRVEITEIEEAIIKVSIHEGILSETATYEGYHVISIQSQRHTDLTAKSTDAFGFVYFIRNSDIYKIGITDNLLRRLKELKPDEILNSVRCSNYQEIEKRMHAHFKKRRIPQTEYFRLDAAEVEEAHSMMTELANFDAR